MDAPPPKPILSLLRGGGYRVSFDGVSDVAGEGATVALALQALSAEIARLYETEKGDDTAAADTARRQTDILANDRFIRGHQLQQSVMLAAAMGLI